MDRYKVYLMGLVHDIGKITLFSELCKQFKLNGASDSPGYSAFAPAMKKTSTHLSYLIACDWDLPLDICEALKQQIGLTGESELSIYGHLLYQANIATELYAMTPISKRKNLDSLLEEFALPKDFWKTLDSVTTQL
jgi:HD-like signal output (HDOD) protein